MKPIPPWSCTDSPQRWAIASRHVRARDRHGLVAVVAVVGERQRGVPGGGARRLELDEQVGESVLQRLEAADRPAELHAILRVLDRPFEQRFARAHHFGGLHERRELQRPRDFGLRRAGRRDDLVVGDGHGVERHLGPAARQVHGPYDSRADTVGGPRNQHEPAAGLRPDSDEQHVGCRRAGNEPGDAGE